MTNIGIMAARGKTNAASIGTKAESTTLNHGSSRGVSRSVSLSVALVSVTRNLRRRQGATIDGWMCPNPPDRAEGFGYLLLNAESRRCCSVVRKCERENITRRSAISRGRGRAAEDVAIQSRCTRSERNEPLTIVARCMGTRNSARPLVQAHRNARQCERRCRCLRNAGFTCVRAASSGGR
jgi:hypothetical protein